MSFLCFCRNSQTLEVKEDLPALPELDVEPTPAIRQNREQTPPHQEPTQAALSSEEKEEADSPSRGLNKRDAADDQRDVAPPALKRRVLPAWMMAAVAAPHTSSSSTSSSSPRAVKRSKGPAAAKQATPTTTSSPEGAEPREVEEQMPKKKRRKMCDEEEAQSKTEPTVRLRSEPNEVQQSYESDDVTVEAEEEVRGGETSTADRSSTTRTSGTKESENKTKNRQRTTKKVGGSVSKLRTPCPYGKDCYRKNPVHFQDCSHPGDTDYEEEEEEEEEEERPECPYGTDCYRKNPLHRREYKHTKRPARTTRTVPQKSPADVDDDDDSFINDDSEDAGDDSDYAPPDSDDSGKEDIKELQREAKALLKRRK
ncbi:hypothetical protein PAMP_021564 [Pampus punctatissimus]